MTEAMSGAAYRAKLEEAKRFDIVEIRWRDSSRVMYGWDKIKTYVETIDDGMNGTLERTVGYFLAANDAFVLVVGSIAGASPDRESNVSDGMMIPHEAVRTFEILKAEEA